MRVLLTVSALTRVELNEEVEVPDGTAQEVLERMAEDLYESADCEDFAEDIEFWEKGSVQAAIL